MTVTKKPGLRKSVDDKCKMCIYDPKAAGTWRQQVTLCSVTICPLYPVRPVTKSPIPIRVLKYYSVPKSEYAFYGCSRPPEDPITEHNEVESCRDEECLKTAAEKDSYGGDSP